MKLRDTPGVSIRLIPFDENAPELEICDEGKLDELIAARLKLGISSHPAEFQAGELKVKMIVFCPVGHQQNLGKRDMLRDDPLRKPCKKCNGEVCHFKRRDPTAFANGGAAKQACLCGWLHDPQDKGPSRLPSSSGTVTRLVR